MHSEVGRHALAGEGDGGEAAEGHGVPHVKTVNNVLDIVMELLQIKQIIVVGNNSLLNIFLNFVTIDMHANYNGNYFLSPFIYF